MADEGLDIRALKELASIRLSGLKPEVKKNVEWQEIGSSAQTVISSWWYCLISSTIKNTPA